jgi:ATP-binding cassette, subfamily B, bacterial PglK
MLKNIKNLWSHLLIKRKKRIIMIFIIMIVSSIFEIVSIGAILPFLSVLISPDQFYQHHLIQPIVQNLNIDEPSQLVTPITYSFIVIILMAAAIRLTLLYMITKLSYAIGSDLSLEIFKRTLYQDYSVHTSRNSSEVINGIISKVSMIVGGVVMPVLVFVSSATILIGAAGILIIFKTSVVLLVLLGFSVMYWLMIRVTRGQIKSNSKDLSQESNRMIKILQEGLGGIRDILINHTQKFYCRLYYSSDVAFRKAAGSNHFIGMSPRYIMEAVGMVLIVTIAYLAIQGKGESAVVIPILGVFALGAQKILPILQQMYNSFNTIKGSEDSFKDVLRLLNQPLPLYYDRPLSINKVKFNKDIHLKNVSFHYSNDSKLILNNVSAKFKKGDRIGVIGVTGSGKSTITDIIMGLLSPVEGSLIVDDCIINNTNINSWWLHIAHVPQNIYLSDGSIEENIAFGLSEEEIDHKQVKKAAKQAQISELIESWSDGYKTLVGEGGVKISGGQRQRVGIARALYKNASVLVFDEATSALDGDTERAVMKAIDGLGPDLTIFIIAHRLSTLKGCKYIIKVENKSITYEH